MVDRDERYARWHPLRPRFPELRVTPVRTGRPPMTRCRSDEARRTNAGRPWSAVCWHRPAANRLRHGTGWGSQRVGRSACAVPPPAPVCPGAGRAVGAGLPSQGGVQVQDPQDRGSVIGRAPIGRSGPKSWAPDHGAKLCQILSDMVILLSRWCGAPALGLAGPRRLPAASETRRPGPAPSPATPE